MINRVINWLTGYVEFSFSGGFASDFLDECYQLHLNIYDIRYEEALVARCPVAAYKYLHKIAHRHGGKIKIHKKCGLPFCISKILVRPGLAVGCVMFVALFCFLSGFVWNIEYIGNKTVEDSRIETFLDKQDFRIGTHWNVKEKQKIEDLMLASFDEIAWVHINRVGTTAYVEIQEATPKPDIESKTYTNLTATKDGVIVFAMVRDGWQQAFVGDSVTKGTVLVSGVNTPEKKKENFFAHASGDFIARVNEKFALTVSREQCRKEYTAEKEYRAISFFGLYLPLYIGKIPKKNTEIERHNIYLTINKKPIPIGTVKTYVKTYNIYTVTLSDKELLKLTDSLIEQKLSANYGKNNVVSKDIKVALNSNSAVASGRVEVLENIGEEVRLISKKPKQSKKTAN